MFSFCNYIAVINNWLVKFNDRKKHGEKSIVWMSYCGR